MNRFRLMKERQDIQHFMDEWDKAHPYTVEKFYPKTKTDSKRKERPKTVKEKRSENMKHFRKMNGLLKEYHPIDPKQEKEVAYNIPLTCKL